MSEGPVFALHERADLTTEAELRAEVTRLEWIIRATARHENKTAIVVSLVPDAGEKVSIVVTGPAYKPNVLARLARDVMRLYLEVYRSVRLASVDRALKELKASKVPR